MDFSSALLSFPPDNVASLTPAEYDKEIRGFLTSLGSISAHKLGGVPENGQDPLEMLDPAVNTVSYLAVLSARVNLTLRSKSNAPPPAPLTLENPLTQKILGFLEKFDPVQVRYLGHEWRRMFECICSVTVQNVTYAPLLVQNLRAAILRLDETAATLTSNHLYFMQACLDAGAFKEALPILEKVQHSFPTPVSLGIDGPYPCSKHTSSSGFITVKSGLTEDIRLAEVQEYFLLGAMAYIALRKWDEALLYLELVLVTPNQNVADGFMLEAFKKWILVGCLLNGHPPDGFNSSINMHTLRTLKAAAKHYDSLGEIFASYDYPRLYAQIEAGWRYWQEDGNAGLTRELLKRLKMFHVLGLQKIYAALPLSKVGSYLDLRPAETHAYIENLIASGQLNATMTTSGDTKDDVVVVRFHTNITSGPLATNEEQLYEQLVRQTEKTNGLCEYVKAADRKLSLNRHYIDSIRRKVRGKGEEDVEGQPEGQEPTPWQQEGFADEDLMELS